MPQFASRRGILADLYLQEFGGAEISCAGLSFDLQGSLMAVVSGKAGVWARPVPFRRAGTHRLLLKPLDSLRRKSHIPRPQLFHLHFLHPTHHSATATLSGLLKPVVLIVHPIPVARKYANLPLFPVPDVKIGWIGILQRELKVRGGRSTQTNHADLSNIGQERALANDNEESDDELPSLEELTARPPNISSEAAKTERTLPHLKQPARDGTGLQVNRIQSGLGGRQGDSQGRRTGSLSFLCVVR